jgi:hypothetical protein
MKMGNKEFSCSVVLKVDSTEPAGRRGLCVKRLPAEAYVDAAPRPTFNVFGAFDKDCLYGRIVAGKELRSTAASECWQALRRMHRAAWTELDLYLCAPAAATFLLMNLIGRSLARSEEANKVRLADARVGPQLPALSVAVAPRPTFIVFGAFDGILLFRKSEAGSELEDVGSSQRRHGLSLCCYAILIQPAFHFFAPETVAPFSVLFTFGAALVVVVRVVLVAVQFWQAADGLVGRVGSIILQGSPIRLLGLSRGRCAPYSFPCFGAALSSCKMFAWRRSEVVMWLAQTYRALF